MITIKEYAEQKKVSYQNVNQVIKRHNIELLDGETPSGKKVRYLSDESVALLDKYISNNQSATELITQDMANFFQKELLKEKEERLKIKDELIAEQNKTFEEAVITRNELLNRVEQSLLERDSVSGLLEENKILKERIAVLEQKLWSAVEEKAVLKEKLEIEKKKKWYQKLGGS